MQYPSQHSVVTVKPGGTERPMEDISARLAPFPPRRDLAEGPDPEEE